MKLHVILESKAYGRGGIINCFKGPSKSYIILWFHWAKNYFFQIYLQFLCSWKSVVKKCITAVTYHNSSSCLSYEISIVKLQTLHSFSWWWCWCYCVRWVLHFTIELETDIYLLLLFCQNILMMQLNDLAFLSH